MLTKILIFFLLIKICLSFTRPKNIKRQFFQEDENLCDCLPLSFKSRVVNGTEVKNTDFRWVVAIINKVIGLPTCTGTLLSHLTVLTAAHCFSGNYSAFDYEVIVGLNSEEEFQKKRIKYTRSITDIIFYPFYDNKEKKSPNSKDLAIIILNEKYELGKRKNILPVCILDEEVENPEAETYFFAGYGLTKPFFKELTLKNLLEFSFAKSLNQIDLEYDRKTCDLEKSFDFFCLKNLHGALCYADSGGGAYIYLSDARKFVLVSTLASGKTKLLDTGLIGRCYEGSSVYTIKISKALPWIKEFGNPICLITRNLYHSDQNYDY